MHFTHAYVFHELTNIKYTHLTHLTLKGIVHPNMKIVSFTLPQVVPNLYECLCSAKHKGRYFEESLYADCFGAPLTSIVGKNYNMEVNDAPELLCFPYSSEYLPLCSAEQTHSYRFGTTWGRVNDDRIFFLWVNYPFKYTNTYLTCPCQTVGHYWNSQSFVWGEMSVTCVNLNKQTMLLSNQPVGR